MDKLTILKYPDPRLRQACQPVEAFDEPLRQLAARMLELMKASNGVGLAGPQVGYMYRLFVCNHTGQPEDDQVMVNPVLSDLEGRTEGEEGCLSIPEVLVPIRRAQSCLLQARDASGKSFELTGADLPARVWQHEMDHINGKLILDYMNDADRIANRRSIKQLEASFKA